MTAIALPQVTQHYERKSTVEVQEILKAAQTLEALRVLVTPSGDCIWDVEVDLAGVLREG